MSRRVRWFVLLVGLAVVASAAGCTYVKNRGNDFLDIVWFDVGIVQRHGIAKFFNCDRPNFW